MRWPGIGITARNRTSSSPKSSVLKQVKVPKVTVTDRALGTGVATKDGRTSTAVGSTRLATTVGTADAVAEADLVTDAEGVGDAVGVGLTVAVDGEVGVCVGVSVALGDVVAVVVAVGASPFAAMAVDCADAFDWALLSAHPADARSKLPAASSDTSDATCCFITLPPCPSLEHDRLLRARCLCTPGVACDNPRVWLCSDLSGHAGYLIGVALPDAGG